MLTPKKWAALPLVTFAVAGVIADLLGRPTALVLLVIAVLGGAWFMSESAHPVPAVVLLLVGGGFGVLTGRTPFTFYTALAATLILSGPEVIRWVAIPFALFGIGALGWFVGDLVGNLVPALRSVVITVIGTAGIALAIAAGWFLVYGDLTPLRRRTMLLGGRMLGWWNGLETWWRRRRTRIAEGS